MQLFLQTGEEIVKENNYKPGKPNWKEILERWKKDKYDSYYFFPNDLNEWYTRHREIIGANCIVNNSWDES